MKKKKLGWYNKKLDTIAKTFAKERDGYICQKCGEGVAGSNAHGSHVIPVSAGNVLRWDLENIKCLSYHSHLNWWHKSPTESGEWFSEKFPGRMIHIQSRRHMVLKTTLTQLDEFYRLALKCDGWGQYQDVYERCFDEWTA